MCRLITFLLASVLAADVACAANRRRLLAIGDSITAANQWQQRVGELLDMDVRSHCKGGVGMLQMVDGDGCGPTPADYDPDTFGVNALYRLSARDVEGVDLILLMGFYNDRYLLRDGRRGTAADISAEPTTFCGRLNYAVRRIQEELAAAGNRNAKIVLISPHCYGKYAWNDVDGTVDGQEMVSAIREVAVARGLPFVDAYSLAGIGPSNWNLYQRASAPNSSDYLPEGGGENTGVGKPFASLSVAPNPADYKGRSITVRDRRGSFFSDGRRWVPQPMPAPWNADQLHLNQDGYRKLGEAIAGELVRLGLIEGSRSHQRNTNAQKGGRRS